jgi:nitroreductase
VTVVSELHIEINQLIRNRWSSRNYDPDRPVPAEMIDRLLEAARWAPSGRNRQPWRYIVFDGRNEGALAQARACLDPGNQEWANRAPVLLLAAAKTLHEGGRTNAAALHDLGLANENVLLQAISMGLHCRPMGGFDRECAKQSFGIPDEFHPMVMIAVGFPGRIDDLSEGVQSKGSALRTRREIEAFAFLGAWEVKYLTGRESS